VGGVVVHTEIGTLPSGASTNWVDPASDATYRLTCVLTFSDGVIVGIGQLVETRTTGTVISATVGKQVQLIAHDCDFVEVSASSAGTSGGRTFSPTWLIDDGAQTSSGLTFDGIISESTFIDIAFEGVLDLSQWVDVTPLTRPVYYAHLGKWCPHS
jgi:hypothetical protein